MSVLKMIVVDDKHYVSGEPHGSRAEWVYAACSRNPQSLAELDKLMPEFGRDENLRPVFGGCTAGLNLEPVDAGLIIVDLAKKWIYARDSYFGAHRRGSYSPRDDDDLLVEYEFDKEWQFVAEPKWFRYLHSLGLQPYGDLKGPRYEKAEYDGFSADDLEFEEQTEFAPSQHDEEDWYDSGCDVDHINRITSLVDFHPVNADEERDATTLEHIADYDNQAATAQCRIEKAQKAIASFKIELQAAENLWNRTGEPCWRITRIKFQAEIGRQEKHIFAWTEKHLQAAAMAAELRHLLVTGKAKAFLKMWEDEEKNRANRDEEGMLF
jgi:hypothetical protein